MNEMLKQLRDIKPPVEVPDHSLLLLLGTAAALIGGAALLYLLFRRKRKGRRRRPDARQIARERLRSIDFSDGKEAVYTFSEYLPVLTEDPEVMEAFEALLGRLEKYKYRPTVPTLEEADRRQMRKLIDKVLKNG